MNFLARVITWAAKVRMRTADTAVEAAPWFDTTGLDTGIERELARYLRRELGHEPGAAASLKAADLSYEGAFDEPQGRVHYWRFSLGNEVAYANVAIDNDGYCMSWGGSNEAPPCKREP
jgi:hypothetical protein